MESLNFKEIKWQDSSLEKDNFKFILNYDFNKDFLDLLNEQKLDHFKKEFVWHIKNNDPTQKNIDLLSNKEISDYFEKSPNPLDKINELRRQYIWNYIDINRHYPIKESEFKLEITSLNTIQKAIINSINWKDPQKLTFSSENEKYELIFLKNIVDNNLKINHINEQWQIDLVQNLNINIKDKSLDNVVWITNKVSKIFFWDNISSIDEQADKIFKENILNQISFIESRIKFRDLHLKTAELNAKLNELVYNFYKEEFWDYPLEIKLNLLNNLIEYKKDKITLSVSNWEYNSNFKDFDSCKHIATYIKEISQSIDWVKYA